MKNLKPLPKDPEEIWKLILKRCLKHGSIMLIHEQDVFNRYQAYTSSFPNFGDVGLCGVNPDLKVALIHTYDGKNSAVQSMLDEIRSYQDSIFQRQYCQYCSIGKSGSFDHYLPKEDYFSFSLLPLNLIPCCDECNRTKGRRVFLDAGGRAFINFYNDDVESSSFLHCEIDYSAGVPRFVFSYDFPRGFDIQLRAIIESHFHLLKLFEQYSSSAGLEFDTVRMEIGGSKNIATIAQSLGKRLESHIKIYGKNYYKTAVLSAIIRDIPLFLKCNEDLGEAVL